MLCNGDIIDKTYQIIDEIGHGAMGVVYLAYHLRLEKYVAMKRFKGTHNDLSLLRNEVDILKGLHHPYLPQVYDYIEYEGEIYTVIDYIDGYDLSYYIKNNYSFSEGQLIKWLTQLCEVLEYLHNQEPCVLHTDIKPANIIVTSSGDICLIDFGISLNSSDSIKGFSANYSSPEQYYNVSCVLNGMFDSQVTLDGRTDIYSLGASFYQIMSLVEPDVTDEYRQPLRELKIGYSDSLVSIVDKAMRRDLNSRYSSAKKMLFDLNNIHKLDIRYKRYVLFQVLSSLLAGVMLLFGIWMIASGANEKTRALYISDYNHFEQVYKAGKDNDTVDCGNAILNNSEYSSLLDNKTKAQILHSIGDTFYTNKDYTNAIIYYEKSVGYSSECDDADIYYRDYAMALIVDDQYDKAQEIYVKVGDMFPQSSSIMLISAQMDFHNGYYDKAAEQLESCIASCSSDDNLYSSWLLYGDISMEQSEYIKASQQYVSARAISENITVLRKLANAYLAGADETQYTNRELLNKAKRCYETIESDYHSSLNDKINLSQVYRLTSDYLSSKRILDELLREYPDDYRIYMQMAFLCGQTGDSQTEYYCKKARTLYKDSVNKGINYSTQEDISKLKDLYRIYCDNSW